MRKGAFLLAGLGLLVTGCVSTQYTGTWQGTADASAEGFHFGGLTLGPDGGYTAYANYGGGTKGYTGTYEIEAGEDGHMLMLEDSGRSYVISRADGTLLIKDPQTGVETTLTRVEDD